MNTVKAIQQALARAAHNQLLAEAALDHRIEELPELRAWKKSQLARRTLESELKQALKTKYLGDTK